MKKVLLSISLVLSLVSCSTDSEPIENPTKDIVSVPVPTKKMTKATWKNADGTVQNVSSFIYQNDKLMSVKTEYPAQPSYNSTQEYSYNGDNLTITNYDASGKIVGISEQEFN